MTRGPLSAGPLWRWRKPATVLVLGVVVGVCVCLGGGWVGVVGLSRGVGAGRSEAFFFFTTPPVAPPLPAMAPLGAEWRVSKIEQNRSLIYDAQSELAYSAV